ncbi:MAG: Xaa-Pro peptidase family protein [Methanocorpusculum sp.]|nr:Xaa-Pro peptidase family protein [Methanocorpusculum sp.]MDE2522570.1 Xaa-Pro peptidase family protein [Methanocorpusculum sp.]MDE2524469.1 Xaa-Pro peptidase family protein [Methanocorpusculum sp.]
MYLKLPKSESDTRLAHLFSALETSDASWDTALVFGRVNLYYLTGTIQDGVLVLRRNGDVQFFVRRSFERAREESPLDAIFPMKSYRDMLEVLPSDLGRTFVETDQVPVAMLDRLQKYFRLDAVLALDPVMLHLRAVKSSYELEFLRTAGREHDRLLMEVVPEILYEGMSEAQLFGELYRAMMEMSYQGVVRFSGFGTEMQIGQIGFGTTTLAATCFDGPGGMLGASPVIPSVGSRDRILTKGDLVFVDIGYGYCGYHTDKTQVYSFSGKLPEHALALHEECIAVQKKAAGLLAAGNIPSEIYAEVIGGLSPGLAENFMGYGSRRVSFLGHGIGLVVNEWPVIARGFDSPLAENMVIALEPKAGVTGVGTVGVEDTYVVGRSGGECITGGGRPVLAL